MQAMALAWLMATGLAGAPWPGVSGVVGICEPWPSCARAVAPALFSVEPGEARSGSGSLVRRTDPSERFPMVRPVSSSMALPPTIEPDSTQGLFEYSDGYVTRLDIHRVASYATLPLFLSQVVIGEVLLRNVGDPPGWAKYSHGPIAGALAGLFVVNTVTGGLNLLEARRDPNVEGRTLLHSMLMILADAGFVWTGMTVSKAGTVAPNARIRTKHRKVALISMGVATTGYLLMIPPFRGY